MNVPTQQKSGTGRQASSVSPIGSEVIYPATINIWKENYSENEEVNLCWTLIPGMIIWAIWKERNRRIFRNQSWTTGKIKETIISITRETIQSRNCQTGRAQLTDQDLRVLEAFQLKDGRNPNQVR
jgi:hypothetical protein